MKVAISSFISGLIFAIGLGISGMMSPSKVQGFLDLFGKWDPSLGLVMGGAVAVTFISFPFILARKEPIFEKKFNVPTNKTIDKNLIIGAVLFGAGWGIGGLCPGPAIANLATLNLNVLLFIPSLIAGFYIQQYLLTPKKVEAKVEKTPSPSLR